MAGEQRGAPRARPWSPSWAAGPRLHSQASAALLAPYACRTSPALQLVAPQPWASASSTPLLLASPSEQHVELRAKLKSAGWAALGGGGAGAVAMVS